MSEKKKILIVDDEPDIRKLMRGLLEDEDYIISEAANADAAFEMLQKENDISLVILDIWLRDSRLDGIGILKQLRKNHPSIPVIMISGHGTIETAVETIKIGAYDFIEKPFKADKLILMVARAIEAARLQSEVISLRALVEEQGRHSSTKHQSKDSAAEGEEEDPQTAFWQGIDGLPIREARERFERFYLQQQIEKYGGNISRTAEAIGMERAALHRKLKNLDFADGKAENRL